MGNSGNKQCEGETTQWAKSPKKQSEGVRFTPSDCFFGDFAYWVYNSKMSIAREGC